MLGDAIYADTTDPTQLRQAYAKLQVNPDWQALNQSSRVLMTWDDHDYGLNDGGAEHPHRAEAQSAFLDLANEPADSQRRKQAGVYASYRVGPVGQRVQIIMLDTRYHRTPLQSVTVGPHTTVLPTINPQATILGEAQWAWLKQQLREEAELRLIVSSIQIINDSHPFEKWANINHERERLYGLIREANPTPILLLSGDQHLAELSRVDGVLDTPLYDFTASGLNNARGWELFPNPRRVGKGYFENHFAQIDIDWQKPGPALNLSVTNELGERVFEYELFDELGKNTPPHANN